jgi:hypothetical protein
MREPGPRSVVNRTTGCELWVGAMRGGTPYDGRRSVLAIRYENANGEPVPPKHRLIRACRNQRCVNLAHVRILGPEESLLYTYAVRERRWLREPEVNEAVAVVSDLAQRLGISFHGLVAHLRWPHSLADDFADALEAPGG